MFILIILQTNSAIPLNICLLDGCVGVHQTAWQIPGQYFGNCTQAVRVTQINNVEINFERMQPHSKAIPSHFTSSLGNVFPCTALG